MLFFIVNKKIIYYRCQVVFRYFYLTNKIKYGIIEGIPDEIVINMHACLAIAAVM